MKLLAWGMSDTGQRREHNEDNFLIDDALGLFGVADGMGGHRGGETASRMALEVLARRIAETIGDLSEAADELERNRPRPSLASLQGLQRDAGWRERLGRAPTAPFGLPAIESPAMAVMRAAAERASDEIFGASQTDERLHGMGTTLTAMFYDRKAMHIVHAGDSRAYRFRQRSLEQLTEDHSWIAEQIRSGQMSEREAKASNMRHVITRSVGFEREVEIDTFSVAAEPGDCFLLCSDGMSNYIDNVEIERLMQVTWHRLIPERFIQIANERGGDDNITVVIVQVANDGSVERVVDSASGPR